MKKLSILIISCCCIFCLMSCNSFYRTIFIPNEENESETNTPQDGEQENHLGDFGKEELVKNMFYSHGDYNDGTYTFRKGDTVGGYFFVYSFSYNPELDLYYCGHLATCRTDFATLHDCGSVVFSWGDIENASFYGYHELENVAVIEFEFENIQFNDDLSLGDNCSYKVTKNTFKALEAIEDIDEYASICFDAIEISIGYAQSILYKYTNNVELW